MLPTKTMTSLADQSERFRDFLRNWHGILLDHPALFVRLEELGVEPRFNAGDGQIELAFTGEVALLRRVWGALRTAGFQTEDRPRPKENSFMSYWRRAGEHSTTIWLYFTSTSCRTVQTGTRMVEQPVYETQCGEPITVPSELAELDV